MLAEAESERSANAAHARATESSQDVVHDLG